MIGKKEKVNAEFHLKFGFQVEPRGSGQMTGEQVNKVASLEATLV